MFITFMMWEVGLKAFCVWSCNCYKMCRPGGFTLFALISNVIVHNNGWMNGWMDGWMDGWVGGWVYVCMYVCMNRWMGRISLL